MEAVTTAAGAAGAAVVAGAGAVVAVVAVVVGVVMPVEVEAAVTFSIRKGACNFSVW